MSSINGDEYTFETVTIYDDNNKGHKPPASFRVPIPKCSKESDSAKKNDVKSEDDCEYAVGIRSTFVSYIQNRIKKYEEMYNVRITVQEMSNEFKLIASGHHSVTAINDILNACRKSKIYNYYLCLPVRGQDFHINLQKLQNNIKNILGQFVGFELRPHVTLALFSLVTDSDIYAVVNALRMTSMSIKSSSAVFKPYTLELNGLESIKYKKKFENRSVLMSNVKLDEDLNDIVQEFQSSVNKAINTILTPPKLKKKVKSTNNIASLTESEAIAKGIHITPSGYIEINFTDVTIEDPNATISNDELNDLINKKGTRMSNMSESLSTPPEVTSTSPCLADSFSIYLSLKSRATPRDRGDDEGVDGMASDEDECVSEVEINFDTSVRHKFHVTLMRHCDVERLNKLEFKSSGEVVCVELRPMGNENCDFKAYSTNELINFIGSRYDYNDLQLDGKHQIAGSAPPNIPSDYLKDINTTQTNDESQRFVFWI